MDAAMTWMETVVSANSSYALPTTHLSLDITLGLPIIEFIQRQARVYCPRIAGSMAAGGYYGRRPKLRARSISRGLSPISS